MVFKAKLIAVFLFALFLSSCGGGEQSSPSTSADISTNSTVSAASAVSPREKARLAAADRATPRLDGPSTISVGETLDLSGRGFLPNMKVTVGFTPRASIHANGTGTDIHGSIRVSPEGTFQREVVFPSSYCTGAPKCIKKPFTPGMQVAVGASGSPGLGARYIATVS